MLPYLLRRRAVTCSSRGSRFYFAKRGLLTRAYAEGPTEPPLHEQTVGQHFAGIVKQYGDRPAVHSRHQRKSLTYDALDRGSHALARGLAREGVKKGDRVAVSLGNNVEFATVTYALFKLGSILVPLNPAFTSAQVIAGLNHLEASHLIIGLETNLPRKPPRSNISLLRHIAPNLESSNFESALVPSLRSIITVDNTLGRIDAADFKALHMYTSISIHNPDSLPSADLSPHDTVNIQFTSGTTSTPKAAMLTHHSILNNGYSIGSRMLLTPEDVVCCPPPLFHCFGSILGYMATATHGASIIFPTEAFDAKATLDAVREYRATALYGVPTMFTAELALLTGSDEGFPHLRTGIAAGSSVPAELMRKLHARLNLKELTICYGMTETSPVSTMTTTDDPMAKRIDSVGKLLPHVRIKIVDPSDQQRVLSVGERGEVVVAGYLVMKGYWGDEEKTKQVLVPDEEGTLWMHTGDEGALDASGYLRITGRIKDLIIRGGENIHPLEVENCLLAHPSVSEVAVVGLPDERYGEVVAAFVTPVAGKNLEADEIRDYVRGKLSYHLVPKYVFWTEDYPKTPSGKVQKFKLREEGMKRLSGGDGM